MTRRRVLSIITAAAAIAAFVDKVRATTGSATVDIVGHSLGGMMPRQYLKFEGGAGTLLLLGFSGPFLGAAAAQQARGSDFLARRGAGGDTVPGVTYVVVATRFDEATTPYESTFLTAGPGATVHNITLRDGCPIDLADHLSMTYSPRAIGIVRQGLDRAASPPPCVPHLPVL